MVVTLTPGNQPLVLKGKIIRSDLFSESFILSMSHHPNQMLE